MNQTLRIRSARAAELPQLAELIRSRLPDLMKSDDIQQREQIEKRLATLLPDGCLQLAIENRKLVGVAAVDLDRARLLATYLDPELARFDVTRELLTSIENHAAAFGIQRLSCSAKPQAWTFMERMGYRATDLPDPHRPIQLSKRLLDDAPSWVQEIVGLHRTLGIPANYGVKRRLKLINDCNKLVSIGNDIFGRETRLEAETADAWHKMQVEARRNDIELQLVSGFRSRNYQTGLIRKKLVANQPIEKILRASAAPGYSEHHSGQAIDLNSPGVEPLTSDFSMSRAYEWLKSRARLYGFRETYPINNRHGLDWEPWHWYYQPKPERQSKAD